MNHDEKKLKRQLQEMQIGHAVKKEQRKSAKVRRAMSTGAEERFDARAVLGADAEAIEDFAPRTRVRAVRARVAAPSNTRPAQASDTVGTVSAVFPGACRVRVGGADRDCRLAPAIAVDQRSTLAVGDAVRVSEQGDVLRVEEVLPRRTRLARADPSQPGLERVLAANVDVVLVATAFLAPGVKPGLIDRVLLAARDAGCEAVVCVNKLDLLHAGGAAASAELALLAPYGERGVEVYQCSARTGEGLERLRSRLSGSTAVLVGQSGCGKTSLLNALVPGMALATGASRASDGKGRHTTTASSLHALAHGGYLIDTPGVRQWGLWDAGEEALEAAFPDVSVLALGCRFRDCGHGREPGCAVRAAVARGDLAASRLASYERLRAGSGDD